MCEEGRGYYLRPPTILEGERIRGVSKKSPSGSWFLFSEVRANSKRLSPITSSTNIQVPIVEAVCKRATLILITEDAFARLQSNQKEALLYT